MKAVHVTLAAALCGACSSTPSAGTNADGSAGATGTAGATSAAGATGTAGAAGAAGVSGAAGGGSGGVFACPNLPTAGTWEDITPTTARGLDGTVYNAQALMIDPFDSRTLWLGTAKPETSTADARTGLFRSNDCGATWSHVDTGQNSDLLERSSLWSMAIDPVDKGVLYTVGANGALGLFKSINAGVDWQQLFPAGSEFAKHVQANFVGAVVMDPTDHRHLVVTSHGSCSAPYGAGASACQAETLDAGVTWTIVPNPNGLGFQENAGAYLIGANNWLYADPATSTFRTTDHGKTWKLVGPGAQGGEGRARPLVAAPDGAFYLPSDHGVLTSADEGASWTLLPNTPMSYGFAIGGGHLYTSPEFIASYKTASLSDPKTWTAMPTPPSRAPNRGAAFMDYDEAHHLLYTSNLQGGLFRMVTP
jgi:hypothetical protein